MQIDITLTAKYITIEFRNPESKFSLQLVLFEPVRFAHDKKKRKENLVEIVFGALETALQQPIDSQVLWDACCEASKRPD